MNIPMLQYFAAIRVGMGRTGVPVASRYLAAAYRFFRARRTNDLFKNLTAVAWMHGGVAVAVKNDCRHWAAGGRTRPCERDRRLGA